MRSPEGGPTPTPDQWVTWTLDLAVAGGTLSVTAIAYAELRVLRSERRETRFRELTDRVYVPLRRVYQRVEKREVPHLEMISADEYELSEPRVWDKLRAEAPYVAARVPKDLARLFDQGNELFRTADRLGPRAERAAGAHMVSLVRSRYSLGNGETVDVQVRLWHGDRFLAHIFLYEVWLSGLGLRNWCFRRDWEFGEPGDWRLELFVDGRSVGTTEDVESFYAELAGSLAREEASRDFLRTWEELRSLAPHVIRRLDAGLQRGGPA